MRPLVYGFFKFKILEMQKKIMMQLNLLEA